MSAAGSLARPFPAPYAFLGSDTRGRRYPEPPHPYRSEFQRDRDRIIHSRAFRRLENKTQVFPKRYSDHFRNRLTHTLEVAQISRTVATALGLNAELAETLALAHDLGHPPFGHAGEAALNRAMASLGGFDHNLHALRVVEHLERRYAEFPGLNLTFEVREGLIKHSRDYPPGEIGLEEYELALRPPLEAQVIDWTDEISYNAADLDDAYEARLLTPEQIRREVPVFARFVAQAETRYPQAAEKLHFNEALRRLIDYFATDLIQETERRASAFIGADQVRQHPQRLAGLSSQAAAERLELKQFLHRHLYNHPRLQSEKRRGECMV
ncbi:MAG: dGTP triphosphohydrolase, partial [Terriglobales bacterium]